LYNQHGNDARSVGGDGTPLDCAGETSMPNDDIHGQERTDWESIGRKLLYRELCSCGQDVNHDLHEIATDIRKGDNPDKKQIRDAREKLDHALSILEEELGPTGGGTVVTEYEIEEAVCDD